MDRNKATLPIARYHLEPQTGTAFTIQKDHRIRASQIPTAFNVFMNTAISPDGTITINTPLSGAGDYIELQAQMDLIIGVTACSAGKCNNFKCSAVDIEVFAARERN